MPIYEFHQPYRPDGTSTDPSRWEFQMYAEGLDGFPVDPAPVATFGEPFYFSCEYSSVRYQCENNWAPAWRYGSAASQEDIDACIQTNLDQCVSVLTDDLPYASGWVQVKACGDGEVCSSWSGPTPVPSAPFDVMLFVGLVGLAMFGRKR